MPIYQAHSRRLVIGQDGRFHVGHQGRTLQTKVLIKQLDRILIYMIDYYLTWWLNLPNIRRVAKLLLLAFENVSGLKINYTKSLRPAAFEFRRGRKYVICKHFRM